MLNSQPEAAQQITLYVKCSNSAKHSMPPISIT